MSVKTHVGPVSIGMHLTNRNHHKNQETFPYINMTGVEYTATILGVEMLEREEDDGDEPFTQQLS